MEETSSRFVSLDGSFEVLLHNQTKPTLQDVAFFTEFLQAKGETRSETAEIPPTELNKL